MRDNLQLIITEVPTGFDPADVKRNESQEMYRKVKGLKGKGFTWLHRLCLGDMVGLSGHVPGTVVTMTAPVSAVHHPNHTAPLLGLQLIASEPGDKDPVGQVLFLTVYRRVKRKADPVFY